MTWTKAEIPSLAGRLAVITGTGGLGFEAAQAFAQAGANVLLAGRSQSKGQAAIERIPQRWPGQSARFVPLDLASLSSVRTFSEGLIDSGQPVDYLINNAGVMGLPARRLTEDGFELQFGTNYLGHFALTLRLLPLLARSNAARVVTVSSSTHKFGRLAFDDLQAERRYNPDAAYAQSKLATLMFALELDRRLKQANLPILSNSAHPGISRTDLMSNGPTGRPVVQFLSHCIERVLGQSSADGVLPVLRAATEPLSAGGEYYGPKGCLEIKGPPALATVSARAQDVAACQRLWEESLKLTRLSMPDLLCQPSRRDAP